MHETHASWVFVAGERAYKVKKPVALGFLDYSTPERRHRACIEEVRVNQELAPGIYLGVRAIVRTGTGFAFAPDDRTSQAVEYAVEMRSFDEADTLAGLIAREALSPEHLEAVARRLVAFHRSAPVAPGGGAAEVLGVWRQNVSELRGAAGRLLELPVDLAEGFGEMFVRVHEREIERRRDAGLVRDLHGDLRCEHVLAIPSVRIVDRIEFDPSLRRGDVARDLAFLTMDLEAHGQRWAAETLLSAYRASGMDAGSDALLCFYGAHLALVRAKVALIAAAEHDGERSTELLAQARSMWTLAERLCWRARAPVALVICGPSASGKSTLAAELADRSGFAMLSSDAVRKSAAGLGATERAGPEHYSHRFTHRTYELLAGQAHELMRRGVGVIVDATCRSRADRSTLLGRLARTGMPRLVVRCEIPLEVALARAARRERDPARVSDASPQIVAEQYRSFQPLEELPREDVLELDTLAPLDTQASTVARALDRLLRARAGAGADR
ncbi:MAG: AAA family ATPase [Solirubrobacteraceae bacterium]